MSCVLANPFPDQHNMVTHMHLRRHQVIIWPRSLFRSLLIILLFQFCEFWPNINRRDASSICSSVLKYRVFKKVAPLQFFGIFSLRLSIFAWNFANLLAVHIQIYLPIFVDLDISSNGVNYFTSTHRFHLSSFEYSPRNENTLYQLSRNDVIFSSSRVLCPASVSGDNRGRKRK